MRSPIRSARLKSALTPTRQSSYVCLQCRASRLLPQLARRYASNDSSSSRSASSSPSKSGSNSEFIERTRRRIWGTETPPGQRDPYQPLTPEERIRDQQQKEQDVKKEAEQAIVQEAEAEYVPAMSGEGLERIGGPTGWWEEEWDRENVYRGFLTEHKITHGEAAATVRRVLIELLALQEDGRPLSQCWQSSTDRNDHVNYAGIEIVVADGGQARLSYRDPAMHSWLMESLQPEELIEEMDDMDTAEMVVEPETKHEASGEANATLLAADKDTGTVGTGEPLSSNQNIEAQAEEIAKDSEEEATEDTEVLMDKLEDERAQRLEAALIEEAQAAEQEKSWLQVPLNDLAFKFAFMKRLMSLSGIRIHDPKINEFSTVGDVVSHMSEKPKPKKLVDILLANSELMALPNVEVFERRHTPIDKEKEVGRWKLIETELLRRGLPVTGHQVS